MSLSLIPKTNPVTLPNSRRNVSASFGGNIGIPIDRDGGVITEIVLHCTAQGAFLVAPTAVDVRQLIERINLRSNTGDLIKSLSGQQIVDMARLTEEQATPVFVPGAGAGAVGSVSFPLELHMEFDGAYFDERGSLKTIDISKLDLEIIPSSLAKTQAIAFVGSTFAAVPAYTFTVDPELVTRPDMALRPDVGTENHLLSSREESGTTTGKKTIELDPKNMTRFIGIHVDNIAAGVDGAIPSDAIVTSVKITQGSRVLVDTDFTKLRFSTQRARNIDVTGFAVIDAGDQNDAFFKLGTAPVFLELEIASGSPAWRVQVAQDYAKPKTLDQ